VMLPTFRPTSGLRACLICHFTQHEEVPRPLLTTRVQAERHRVVWAWQTRAPAQHRFRSVQQQRQRQQQQQPDRARHVEEL
jgi:hypothetical protein